MSQNHLGLSFTNLELLQAYVSERLDRLVDHMISRGDSRLAVLGSRGHIGWLQRNIYGFRHLPITALIDRPDYAGEPGDVGVPVFSLDDHVIPLHADTILVADDHCEQALHQLALDRAPLGTTVYRIYHRFPIGVEPLGPKDSGAIVEAKPEASTREQVITEPKPVEQGLGVHAN